MRQSICHPPNTRIPIHASESQARPHDPLTLLPQLVLLRQRHVARCDGRGAPISARLVVLLPALVPHRLRRAHGHVPGLGQRLLAPLSGLAHGALGPPHATLALAAPRALLHLPRLTPLPLDLHHYLALWIDRLNPPSQLAATLRSQLRRTSEPQLSVTTPLQRLNPPPQPSMSA